MITDNEHKPITRLLRIYKNNLNDLEEQAAAFGGEQLAPLSVKNLLRTTRAKIAELEQQLTSASAQQPAQPVTVPPTPPLSPILDPIVVTLEFTVTSSETQITWMSDLTGREVTTFSPPYDDVELALVVRALDVLQYPNYPAPHGEGERQLFTFSQYEQDILIAHGLWSSDRLISDGYQVVGYAIYKGLGRDGQAIIKAVRNAAIAQRLLLAYTLRFPPETIALASLPWELMWDKANNQSILIRGSTVDSCVRYVATNIAMPPSLPHGTTVDLLALAPQYGIPETVRHQERMARLQTWDKLKAQHKLNYSEISPLTMSALNDHLRTTRNKPDIVHFYGHGTYKNGKGYLLFDNGQGGVDRVSAERLAAVLGDIRLIVIHACQSAMVNDTGGLLSGVAPALSIVANAVVAMQLTIRISAATRFEQVFYDEVLGRGRSVQTAVAQARQILFSEEADGASWYIPTLFIRSREQRPIILVQ